MRKFRTFLGRGMAAALAASLILFFATGNVNEVMGQGGGTVYVLYPSAAPSGACGFSQIRIVRSSGEIYGCVDSGGGPVWTLIQTTGGSSDWNTLTNKPSTFAPSAHHTSHETGGTDPITVTKSQVGLGNVDNTADTAKPVSTLTQAALDNKVDATTTVNGHALSTNVTVTKGDVGLGSVDNTSDAAKPVSTAVSTALAGKVDTTRTINGQALSSNITLVKGDIGLGNVDNTSDAAKPLSSAATTALAGKVATTTTVNGHALSANVTVTAGDVGLGNVDNTSDANKPISTATQNAINALNVFKGKGTYASMTGATTSTNDIWLQTDAPTSGFCGGGGGASFAICVKDGSGVWQPILATTAGTGGGGGSGGGTTTTYGGFTGGGTTVSVTDTTCNNASDDTAAVQAVFNTVANNGTIDFTNTTNSCEITAAGLGLSTKSNVRITHSPTTYPANGVLRAMATITGTDELAMIDINDCDNCLIDRLKINANSQNAGGIFINNSTNFSIQNNEVYGSNYGTGSGPYAAIKADDQTTNFWIANNNLHDLAGVNGGEGVRGIWAGVGGRYSVSAHLIDNTVANTGHTGVITEGEGPIVTGNLISNTNTQGTCMKYIPRGSTTPDAVFDNNTCNRAYGAGMQIETDSVYPTHIYVRNNQFTLMSDNTLNPGSDFGALYLSGGSGGGRNVTFTGNTITQGRKVAAMNNTDNVLLQNNTIVSGLGSFYTQVSLESGTVTNVTIINSGTADIQGGCTCSQIFQDGVQIASLYERRREENLIIVAGVAALARPRRRFLDMELP